jgi:hypothetical protein
MPLLALIAVTSIACFNPAHRDGQSVRCGDRAAVLQLEGIKAPPIAGDCVNSNCAEDPGIVARDHLADLTRGQSLVCRINGSGRLKSGRPPTARCEMHGIDLSCAMVADRMAEKSGPLLCPVDQDKARREAEIAEQAKNFLNLPPLWRWIPLLRLFHRQKPRHPWPAPRLPRPSPHPRPVRRRPRRHLRPAPARSPH